MVSCYSCTVLAVLEMVTVLGKYMIHYLVAFPVALHGFGELTGQVRSMKYIPGRNLKFVEQTLPWSSPWKGFANQAEFPLTHVYCSTIRFVIACPGCSCISLYQQWSLFDFGSVCCAYCNYQHGGMGRAMTIEAENVWHEYLSDKGNRCGWGGCFSRRSWCKKRYTSWVRQIASVLVLAALSCYPVPSGRGLAWSIHRPWVVLSFLPTSMHMQAPRILWTLEGHGKMQKQKKRGFVQQTRYIHAQ